MARKPEFERKEEKVKSSPSSRSSRGRQNVTIPASTVAAIGRIDFSPYGPTENPVTATTIALYSGDAQTNRQVGDTLDSPVAVIVTDAAGRPVPGVTVDWAISGSGGITDTSITGIDGIAAASVELGDLVGTYAITATVSALAGSPVSFTASALVGDAYEIHAVTDTNQSGQIGAGAPQIPTVQVTDRFRNAILGHTITWALTGGGGSIGDLSDDTDSAGVSDCTSWTLGASPGLNTVTATAAGLVGSPITFNVDGSGADVVTQIAKQSGDAQTGITAGNAAVAFVARVRDGSNVAVEGATVYWAVLTGAGTLSAATSVTNASGDASITLTTGTVVMANTVRADVIAGDGTTLSQTFTATTVAGARAKVRLVAGVPSNEITGHVWSVQPQAELTDINNNRRLTDTNVGTISITLGGGAFIGTVAVAAVAGLIQWTGLGINGTGAQKCRVDAAGFNNSLGTCTLTDPIADHLVESVAPAAVLINTDLVPSPAAAVVDLNGVPIPNDTSLVTVALNGTGSLTGTLTRAAVTGIATFPGLQVTAAGLKNLIYSRAGMTNINSSSFTATDPNAVSTHPNEPVGFTPFILLDGTVEPSIEDGWGTNGNQHLSIIARQGTERATATSLNLNYPGPLGLAAGTGPITTWKYFPQDASELYVDFDYCMASDYYAHRTFNKWFFICYRGSAAGQPMIFGHGVNGGVGGYGTNAGPSYNMEGCAESVFGNSSSGGRNIRNLSGGSGFNFFMPRDAVVRHIFYLKINTYNLGDGIFRCWSGVNGADPTLRIEATDICMNGTGINNNIAPGAKLHTFKWAPTYGGTYVDPNRPTPTGHQRMGYLYASYKV